MLMNNSVIYYSLNFHILLVDNESNLEKHSLRD